MSRHRYDDDDLTRPAAKFFGMSMGCIFGVVATVLILMFGMFLMCGGCLMIGGALQTVPAARTGR